MFTRGDAKLSHLTQLSGRRIAVGPEGSGTRSIAEMLLTQNGIVSGDAAGSALSDLSGEDAAQALQRGEVGAALFVVAPQAALVRELLADPDVHLMNFARASAYERRYPFLSRVTLAEGMVHLERNLPANDVQLIAPTATSLRAGICIRPWSRCC